MDRFAFAKTAFVVLGAWFLLSYLRGLPWSMRILEEEPMLIVGYLLVISLGVLVILWSGRLARRTVGEGSSSEGAAGPIRLADLQATGIGILGLGLIVWHLPGVLLNLNRLPSYWRSYRTSSGATDHGFLEMTSSLWLSDFLVGVGTLVLGVVLVLAARLLARALSRRLGDPVLASTAQMEPAAPRPPADSSHVQAAALAVLGLYVSAQALPGLALYLLDFDYRSPFAWTLEVPRPYTYWPGFLSELLQVAAGLGLFFGARTLARFWQRLRSSRGALPPLPAGRGDG